MRIIFFIAVLLNLLIIYEVIMNGNYGGLFTLIILIPVTIRIGFDIFT